MNNSVTAIVAVATEEVNDMKKADENQVQYLCNAFEMAKNLDGHYCTGIEPLIIKNSHARTQYGICELIELHGYFNKVTVEKAIFVLKDSGTLSKETLIELVTNKIGFITSIRFLTSKIRMRF